MVKKLLLLLAALSCCQPLYAFQSFAFTNRLSHTAATVVGTFINPYDKLSFTNYYSMDETTGTRADDKGSTDLTNNGAGTRSGMENAAVDFPGTGGTEHLKTSDGTVFIPSTSAAFVVGIHMDVGGTLESAVDFTDNSGTASKLVLIWLATNRLQFFVRETDASAVNVDSADLTGVLGQWLHVVCIAHDGNLHLFVDGVETTASWDGTIDPGVSSWRLRLGEESSQDLNHGIDELGYWKNPVFNSSEERDDFASQLYNGGSWLLFDP